MLGYILGWVALLVRPSWVLLFAFTAAIIVLAAIGVFSQTSDPIVVVPAALISGAVFMVGGGPLVAIRLWLRSRATRQDKDVDAELARIRAEAAAREQGGV